MKTSKVIRRQINRNYRKHGRLLRGMLTATAKTVLEQIKVLEEDYVAAVKREEDESK